MSLAHISIGIIGVILLFWFIIILRFTVIRIFKATSEQNDRKGRVVAGKVTKYQAIGGVNAKMQRVKIEVEFPNFAGTLIRHELMFVDSKPYANRYREGNRIDLRINPEGRIPVQPVGSKLSVGKVFLFISIVLIGGYIYACYWMYKKLMLKIDGDFDQVGALMENSGLVEISLITIGALAFQLLIMRFVMRFASSKKTGVSDTHLKFYGKKTVAQITKYEDTGTTINDNPVVRFHYTFTTESGMQQTSTDKMLVGKLDLSLIHI